MAWNPNVPTVTNRVQDDLNAIRENFQHLNPLAPYVQALLDSRIVDHNLDVADPPNGRYVRWANGLQICWHQFDLDTLAHANQALQASWSFPAVFSGAPAGALLWVRNASTFAPENHEVLPPHTFSANATGFGTIRIYASVGTFAPGNSMRVLGIAVGRWSSS